MHRYLAWLVWMLLPLTAAHAQDTDHNLSPYFFVEAGDDAVEPFTLEATQVHARVNGVIADVSVEQVYRNGGTRPIRARYVFPASTRAAVHGMQIEVGNKRVKAKIQEREQAKKTFEAAAASGTTASLLEQERPNVFSMTVANILPGDRVSVVLQYSELLVPTDGVYQFVYPTVVGPRYAATKSASDQDATKSASDQTASPYMPQGDAPDTSFSMQVDLSTAVPLAELHSNTHKLVVTREQPNLARVTLAKSQGFTGNRDFILEYGLRGAQIESGLLRFEGEHENHFLLMVQPPARVAPSEIPAREYVFVLDVSGSMYGFPLDTAKLLIADLIDQLRPNDRFNVLLFSGDARLLSPRSLPPTHDNVKRAFDLIAAERGAGGTELEAALDTAYALPRSEHVSRSVIILTDGFIAQERGAFELVSQNVDSTNVFAFGIGSSVNRYLIEGLARAGQAEPFIVTEPSAARAVAQRFRRYIEAPVLTEVSVQFHGLDAYDVEPKLQADLFAERPIIVFGKYRGQAGEISITGRGAIAPFSKTLALTSATPRAENAALPQLWARARIARLSDFDVDDHDGNAEREVTELGLRYSLLTKQTSFVAVLEQIRNPGGDAADVDQPLPLPAGVSNEAIGDYASGAEPELVWLLAALLLGFGWVALRRRAVS